MKVATFLAFVLFFTFSAFARADVCEAYRHAIGHPGGAFDAILKASEVLEALHDTSGALRDNSGEAFDALSEIAVNLGASESLDLIRVLKRSWPTGSSTPSG